MYEFIPNFVSPLNPAWNPSIQIVQPKTKQTIPEVVHLKVHKMKLDFVESRHKKSTTFPDKKRKVFTKSVCVCIDIVICGFLQYSTQQCTNTCIRLVQQLYLFLFLILYRQTIIAYLIVYWTKWKERRTCKTDYILMFVFDILPVHCQNEH